jgi:hypothetical protein
MSAVNVYLTIITMPMLRKIFSDAKMAFADTADFNPQACCGKKIYFNFGIFP